jgi:putative oxidoreductase
MDIGLLLLRLTVGLTLAAHGAQKLFGWFGGPGIDATGQFLAMLGFSEGRRHALMAGLAETGGGLLLALGFLTPAAAAVLFSVMLVAALSVHVKKGFFITSGGYEYTLVLGVAALTFAFTGPGSLSVDALVGYSVSGALCGAAALIVGVLGGVITLSQRRSTRAVSPTAG